MKNKIFIILLISISLLSCKKETEAEPIVVVNGSAIIMGQVRADLDLTQVGLEYAPEGTVILAKICLDDLTVTNPNDSISSGSIVYKTTVDTNGRYFLKVDANAYNVDVSVLGEDFEYNQRVNDSVIIRQIYTVATNHCVVIDGMTKIMDLHYN